jgi:hypothetical protein
LISLLGGAWTADAANPNEGTESLGAAAAARNSVPQATAATTQIAPLADDFSLHSPAAGYDRRLASLDPAQLIYARAQDQWRAPAEAAVTQSGLLELGGGRLFARSDLRLTAPQEGRSLEDFLLMGFAALMLIAYQLRKKHRFLRPHPFSY